MLSRKVGESIVIGSDEHSCVVTVIKIVNARGAAIFQIARTTASSPGKLDVFTTELLPHRLIEPFQNVRIVMVDVRDDKARIGITAPREYFVHRLEVFELIRGVHELSRPSELTDTVHDSPPPESSSEGQE